MTDITEEMVELAAKAIYATTPEVMNRVEPTTEMSPAYRSVGRVMSWEDTLEHNRQLFSGFARAALNTVVPMVVKAERGRLLSRLDEPNEAMIEAVWNTRACSRRLIPEIIRALAAAIRSDTGGE